MKRTRTRWGSGGRTEYELDVEVPEVDAFIAEIEAVCRKYGMSIDCEDGVFSIAPWSEKYGLNGLASASDDREWHRAVDASLAARAKMDNAESDSMVVDGSEGGG